VPSRIDLHTHTTASDGTLSAGELLKKAADLQIQTLAIADHDSVAGYEAALELVAQFPKLQLVPAIEINAAGSLTCHLLGYWIDSQNPTLRARLALYRRARVERTRAMVKKLSALGCAIQFERVWELAHQGSVGRPHIADALMEKGYVRNRQEAFDKYLKVDGPAYVPGEIPTAPEAIDLIRGAGGVPVLAHPSYYLSEFLLKGLVDSGLMGLEVYYPDYGPSLIRRYRELAAREHLVVTGGSDFHGPATGRTELACVDVPESVLEGLLEKKRSLKH
jgi:hypothetical protein